MAWSTFVSQHPRQEPNSRGSTEEGWLREWLSLHKDPLYGIKKEWAPLLSMWSLPLRQWEQKEILKMYHALELGATWLFLLHESLWRQASRWRTEVEPFPGRALPAATSVSLLNIHRIVLLPLQNGIKTTYLLPLSGLNVCSLSSTGQEHCRHLVNIPCHSAAFLPHPCPPCRDLTTPPCSPLTLAGPSSMQLDLSSSQSCSAASCLVHLTCL